MTAEIFNIQRFCLHDGDGIRTAVFFKGCPLSCLWCHNPEGQSPARQLMYHSSKCTGCGACLCAARVLENGKIRLDRGKCNLCAKCVPACIAGANEICGRSAEVSEIFEEVLKDLPFYKEAGGMTLSGGEPLMQPEAASQLLSLAKNAGIGTVIETSGAVDRSAFEMTLEYNPQYYYDIKAIDPQKHKKLCGKDNFQILENLEFLFSRGADIVLRLPLIPGLNDSEKDLETLSVFLRENEPYYKRAEIMKYHSFGLSKAAALSKEYTAPKDSADASDAEKWLNRLMANGAEKVIIS